MFIMQAGAELTPELLAKYIELHTKAKARYTRLENEYRGQYEILSQKKKAAHKPDNRIVCNFAKYIVDTLNGYFIGIPIKVTHPEEAVAKYLEYVDKYNDQDDNNAELSKMCSIYGHAFEMLFIDEKAEIGITYISPQECFVIYDDSILQRPMYAVRYYEDLSSGDVVGSFSDSTHIYSFVDGGNQVNPNAQPHYFGDVPIIEYIENEECRSAFEDAESLINAYNKALSEKANDVDYYADAYLKVLGFKLDETSMATMRDNRIINLPGLASADGAVDFLNKPDADSTQENLINRIERLIFHLSMVANINDENFGNASGVALAYKLQSMSNLAKTKERKFVSGMNRRYRMISNVPAGKLRPDSWIDIEYQFTRNVPANVLEEAQTAQALAGITSQETQLKVLSVVDSVKGELMRKEKEVADSAEAFSRALPDSAEVADEMGGEVNEKVKKSALNGAQVTALIGVIQQYESGQLTRDQAINIIMISFGLTTEEAETMIAGDKKINDKAL